ncbi:MAG: glycogen-binding domain-containing protein [Candidatus Bipolaricaulota bacterium]|nr:glycogen-binding domain-containing protein [Candidatus Bipolaricaulota bacterium]
MKRIFGAVIGVLALVGLEVWAQATTCPPGKYSVTFRYVPLPGETVRSVSLRGSFNNWGEWPMARQPDGSWAITVCLDPGEHQYKFFINGRWPRDMATERGGGPVDPEAHGYVDDGFGGRNAVRRVGLFLTGTWDFKVRLVPSPVLDRNRLTLKLPVHGFLLTSLTRMGWGGAFEEQGFELSGLVLGATELKAGMYFDPAAVKYKHTFVEVKPPLAGLALTAKAEHWAEGYLPDNRCPVPVTFRYIPAPGETVYSVNVAGSFDGWNPGDPATEMRYNPATGEWSVTLYLTPGGHQYKYVINGWWPFNMQTDHPVTGGPVDPDLGDWYLNYVEDGLGGKNAVRVVRDPCNLTNMVPVTFRYIPAAGETVTSVNVAGDFDGWNPNDAATAMTYDPVKGEWSVTLNLAPGPHQYKYVINGSWVGNMATDHPVTGGPVDPDAHGYYYENAVRLIRDPMPSYMRYSLALELGNLAATLRFEDCSCGIMFKDLTFTLKNVPFCCGLSFTGELLFTKAGFQHLKLSSDGLFNLCCGIAFGLDVEFGAAFKKVSPRFSWAGITGCLTVYGDVRVSGMAIQGLELYGWRIRCDLPTCGYIEVLTALNVAKIEEIFKADIFRDDEYEMVKLGFCGAGCCGGTWNLAVTAFFSPTGKIFGLKRMWIDAEFPILANLRAVLNVSPTLGEVYAGFVWNF